MSVYRSVVDREPSNRPALRAISGDAALLSLPRPSMLVAHVHSVFTRAINMEWADSGQLCTMKSRGLDNAPNSVIVDIESWEPMRIRPGDTVTLDHDAIRAPGFSVLLTDVPLWSPSLTRLPLGRAPIHELRDLIDAEGVRGGIQSVADGTLLQRETSRMLAEATTGIVEALVSGQTDLIEHHAHRLVGLGPGLTPAGDDFLAGLAVACALSDGPGHTHKATFIRLSLACSGRTNAISHATFVQAAHGRVEESITSLLLAMSRNDVTSMREYARRVIGIGTTSGTDILSGILAGLVVDHRARKSV